ncbi:MAG: hypothetical protein FWC56_05250 [Phycisphaerae bacterium]|nr:hypothetical protein [Phycisphaerae bacterium]
MSTINSGIDINALMQLMAAMNNGRRNVAPRMSPMPRANVNLEMNLSKLFGKGDSKETKAIDAPIVPNAPVDINDMNKDQKKRSILNEILSGGSFNIGF